MDKQLYRNLEHIASRGATLGELEVEIDNRRRLLSDVEREGAWLYAWALRKREERRLLGSAWEKEQGHGYAGDAGAG